MLEATIEVLIESGFDTLSIREVAERADGQRVLDLPAMGEQGQPCRRRAAQQDKARDPDSGHGIFARRSARHAPLCRSRPRPALGESLVRVALRQDTFSNQDRARFWNDRFTRGSAIFDRAEERGDLRSGVDRFLTIETLIGPLYLRMLLTREPLNEGVLETVVDLVLAGIAVEPPSASQLTPRAPK